MRYFVIFLALTSFFMISIHPVFAVCAYDPSNPHEPCEDTYETLIMDLRQAQIENIDGQLFHVIGPFTLQAESNNTLRFGNVEFSYPSYPVPHVPGGVMFVNISFEDGIKESIGRVGPPNPFLEFTKHEQPTAGVKRNSDGTFKFLLSVENQSIPPKKQFESEIPLDEIQCKEGLVLIIRSSDGSPACVKPETKQKLVERGWADPTTLVTNGECTTDLKGYELTKPLSEVYVQRLVLFMKPDSTESFCVFFKSQLENSGNLTLNSQLYTGRINLEEYDGTDVSVSFEPKTASLEYRAKTMIEFNVTTTSDADGVYWLGIDQLGRLPIVVWEDRKSVGANEIPVYSGFRSSGNKVLDSIILGYENDKSFEYVLAEIEK